MKKKQVLFVCIHNSARSQVAVAVAITLFGADSLAALATIVGVLVEVPVMLSVCNICNQSREWYNQCQQSPESRAEANNL
jgi:ACR3 family arsenite efflux pump ArsB